MIEHVSNVHPSDMSWCMGDGAAHEPVSAVAAALAGVVEALLALDVHALSDDELEALVVAVQQERHRLSVAAAEVIAVWDRRAVWSNDGSRSPAHRLARTTHCALRSGRRELERARHLGQMPVTRDAVLDGRLSIDHVDLFADAASEARAWRRICTFPPRSMATSSSTVSSIRSTGRSSPRRSTRSATSCG